MIFLVSLIYNMKTNYSSITDSWSTINLIQPSSQVKDHTEVYVSKTDKNLGSMDNQVEGLTDRFYFETLYVIIF